MGEEALSYNVNVAPQGKAIEKVSQIYTDQTDALSTACKANKRIKYCTEY